MNKKPEEMKINDALDFFDENKSSIRIYESRGKLKCNLEEQVGRIVAFGDLAITIKGEKTTVFACLQSAIKLIQPYLSDENKLAELKNLLNIRSGYKAELIERFGGSENNIDGQNDSKNKRIIPEALKKMQMSLEDALSLFESHELPIRLFGPDLKCNLQEQVGKIVISKGLLEARGEDEKLLLLRLQKAEWVIRQQLKDETKKAKLQETLKQRKKSPTSKKTDGYQPAASQFADDKGRSDDTSTYRITKPIREKVGRRDTSGQDGKPKDEKPKDDSSRKPKKDANKRGTSPNDAHTSDTSGTGTRKKDSVQKIEYTRPGENGKKGNTVTIVEISDKQQEIKIPLKSGEVLNLIPPQLNGGLVTWAEKHFGIKININRYLIMELTPDKKRMYINIVYGNLDLNQMSRDRRFLGLCMESILSRKRIDEVCRNNFCTLDSVGNSKDGTFLAQRDDITDEIVKRSIIEKSMEIRTPIAKPKILNWFGRSNTSQQPEENILRIYKTGVIMIGNQQCAVYNYGTKDQTTEGMVEIGSFIVSGLDEEKFKPGSFYYNEVVRNVINPTNLEHTRRRDLKYPYIGQVTPNGGFENNFEILRELTGLDIQL